MGSMYGYYEPSVTETGADAIFFMMAFFAIFYLIMLAFGIVVYILQSLGYYTIAKRRGISNPWLAWFPLGNLWIIGSISDQYQYLAKGKVRNRRKILLGLSIATFAMVFVMLGAMFTTFISLAFAESASGLGSMVVGSGIGVWGLLFSWFATMVLEIIMLVYYYIALYDVYVSCEPLNATLYLVLSIFFSVAVPFFVFFSRKKDLGMPPRKAEQPAPAVEPLPAVEEAPVAEVPAEETEA